MGGGGSAASGLLHLGVLAVRSARGVQFGGAGARHPGGRLLVTLANTCSSSGEHLLVILASTCSSSRRTPARHPGEHLLVIPANTCSSSRRTPGSSARLLHLIVIPAQAGIHLDLALAVVLVGLNRRLRHGGRIRSPPVGSRPGFVALSARRPTSLCLSKEKWARERTPRGRALRASCAPGA